MTRNLFKRMKDRLQGNPYAKAFSLLATLVMPISVVDTGIEGILSGAGITPFDLTFCGFYGCIILCLAWERKWLWLKIPLVAINTVLNGFYILMGFMGGVTGPLLLLMQMIIPIPWYKILG